MPARRHERPFSEAASSTRNGRYGREAAGRREVAENGLAAFELETVENCRSPASFRLIYSAPSRS
jgi:hypothetical protein